MFDAWFRRRRKLGPGVHSDLPEKNFFWRAHYYFSSLLLEYNSENQRINIFRYPSKGATSKDRLIITMSSTSTDTVLSADGGHPSELEAAASVGHIWNNKHLQGISHGGSHGNFFISHQPAITKLRERVSFFINSKHQETREGQ